MKFSDHMNAQEMLASVQKVLSDLPGAEVIGFETRDWDALKHRAQRVRFKLPNGLAFELYIETKLEEKAGA